MKSNLSKLFIDAYKNFTYKQIKYSFEHTINFKDIKH